MKNNIVLTAAHCVTSETSITAAETIFVEVGRHTLGSQTEVGYSRVKVSGGGRGERGEGGQL